LKKQPCFLEGGKDRLLNDNAALEQLKKWLRRRKENAAFGICILLCWGR
jgi:hypothetical protein